jgi:hypothetical protein
VFSVRSVVNSAVFEFIDADYRDFDGAGGFCLQSNTEENISYYIPQKLFRMFKLPIILNN